VDGFWSITMYMVDGGWWFVPNPLNTFTVSPRNQLKTNPNGSTTLYFQTESPGKDKESNWLPAPKGEFIPMIRMYAPQHKNPSVLDGSWTPPAIVKANREDWKAESSQRWTVALGGGFGKIVRTFDPAGRQRHLAAAGDRGVEIAAHAGAPSERARDGPRSERDK
jgi:Protein of unknown function (DUF1214)